MGQPRGNRSNTQRVSQRRRTQRDAAIHQCLVCQKYHPLKYCKRFLSMGVRKRKELVERHNYCLNCLARSHTIRSCSSWETCKRCDKLHHTLLHLPRVKVRNVTTINRKSRQNQPQAKVATPNYLRPSKP